MVRQCGARAELAKCGIKSAFHLLLIQLDDFDLLGFAFKEQYFAVGLFL